MANVVSRTFSILLTILFSLILTTTSTFPPPHIPVYSLPLLPSGNHAALALHYAELNSDVTGHVPISADYPLIPFPFPPTALAVFAPERLHFRYERPAFRTTAPTPLFPCLHPSQFAPFTHFQLNSMYFCFGY